MGRLLAWLGIAMLSLVVGARAAEAQGTLKPFMLFIVDNSGSMNGNTGFGPASCAGSGNTRMDHAKCAVQNIANSYGDMVMALARFRITTAGTACTDGCDAGAASPDCSGCQGTDTAGCTPALRDASQFQLLVPLVDGNQSQIANWTDFQCGACSTTATEPELFPFTWTPLAGALTGARRYWQGNDPDFPTSRPIQQDPLATVFLPSGEQCRPYITILLTDGAETCAIFDTHTVPAAQALLTTPVTVGGTSRNYRIETKPIGFGIAPGDAQIEALAHAGGEPDVAGVNEGAYAQNEEQLQIEISQIVADSLRFEQCNSLDDDCDTRIDEDYPQLGMPCDDGEVGICRDTGVFVCNPAGTGVVCNANNTHHPGTETCNGLDDDCDGVVDDGVCQGCGDVELCNNRDDDCDMRVDENLTRPCGTDVGECTAGTETCQAGQWRNCTAMGPFTEVCDRRDNDCDGTVDGFVEECSTIPGGNPNTGPCHPGTRVCPPGGNGTFGPCLGEIGPVPEACDTVDNDCDMTVDEDTGGADCSSTCGRGVTVCENGMLRCDNPGGMGTPEVCNNLDDDCDMLIDEDVPDRVPCADPAGICNGHDVCLNGRYVCQGDPIRPEICDCIDNDCDGFADPNDPNNPPETLCSGGTTCVDPSVGPCQCAPPCSTGEFPCAAGRICDNGSCVVDPCYQLNPPCMPDSTGAATVCRATADPPYHLCVPACEASPCPTGYRCVPESGECVRDDCTTMPDRCTATQHCVDGVCVDDPCAGMTCDPGEYCVGGQCVGSCAGVPCPAGERCRLGECETDPCGHPCPGGQVCQDSTGDCVADRCGSTHPCPIGEACDPLSGTCVQDPCLGVTCPRPDEVCVGGTCYDPDDLPKPDAGTGRQEYVSAAGGGGCCSTGSGDGAGAALLAAVVGLLGSRRRRARAGGGAS